ncbi:methyltransferase family protein [Rhodopila sp.]|uniref:methyltransferase family protein n=1 Tax=Rhodopila sp. TaxID=2480087 RepID=UPI003D0DB7CF
MRTRSLVQNTFWLLLMAVALFASAGDWRWPQAWVFLAESAVSAVAVSTWLARHDPALLRSRLSGFHADQSFWDRLFMVGAFVAFMPWLVLAGLDARRFGWSAMPLALQGLGLVLIAGCMVLVWLVFRSNSFAAPQVRLQAERGQTVISGGPYRFVRHPMYSGALCYFLGVPLLLGSWWALLPVPLFVAALAARAVAEERMLRRDLAGYDAYASQVSYRLLPWVW